MGIKLSNPLALLDFPNFTGQKGSNSDSETSHFAGVVTLPKMYPPLYRSFFLEVSLWEKSLNVMM